MSSITIEQYFGGRRERYGTECSPGIETNAARSVPLFNQLISEAERFGHTFQSVGEGDFKDTIINSGWRPPSINSCTPGASATSLHMSGEAIDLHDPDNSLDGWLMTPEGQYTLTTIGLWMEHPDDTPGWTHVQIKPPASGNRVFKAK